MIKQQLYLNELSREFYRANEDLAGIRPFVGVVANEIASKNPDAVRAAKKLLNEVWHGDSARGFMMESELMMTIMGTPNQLEAITANFTGQAPAFKDPV